LSALLGRQAIHAIKALLELAAEPRRWRSVNDLAAAQELPAPMLEQLLLQLRRAALLEARRGRLGGYRLARPASAIPLAEVLTALSLGLGSEGGKTAREVAGGAADRVAALMEQRLRGALERELARCTLAELLYDLRSIRAELSEEGGLLLG
jgi:Rrf2 family protein